MSTPSAKVLDSFMAARENVVPLLPIDVGFDLRLHSDMATELVSGPYVGVRYLTRAGNVRQLVSTTLVVDRCLKAAGYRVTWKGEPQP